MNMNTMNIQFRDAISSDHKQLTLLAHKAKSHWGYPPEWLLRWQEDLTFTPDYIETHWVRIAMIKGQSVGVIVLEFDPNTRMAEIGHLWIEPEYMGYGIGRQLVQEALNHMENLSCKSLEVISDPNALGFYEKMGGKLVRMHPSWPPGRELPVLAWTK